MSFEEQVKNTVKALDNEEQIIMSSKISETHMFNDMQKYYLKQLKELKDNCLDKERVKEVIKSFAEDYNDKEITPFVVIVELFERLGLE